VRLFPLQQAQASGRPQSVEAFAEQCMADYDEDGWRHPAYRDGSDISVLTTNQKVGGIKHPRAWKSRNTPIRRKLIRWTCRSTALSFVFVCKA